MASVNDDNQNDTGRSGGDATIPFKLGGLLGGLGGFIEKLGELAEAGEELSRSGEFKDASGKLRGVYGINVKTALGKHGQEELKVEPFGNVRRQKEAPPGEDVREPLVDLHEEEDHLLVLVELPGVSKANVHIELAGDRLNLTAERGKTTYRKTITLPAQFADEDMHWDCKNGILRIRFRR